MKIIFKATKNNSNMQKIVILVLLILLRVKYLKLDENQPQFNQNSFKNIKKVLFIKFKSFSIFLY